MGAEAFQYAVLRVVPRIEREEFLNAGVVVYCPRRRYLAARVELDPALLTALAPDADTASIAAQLDALVRIAAGDPAAGPLAALPPSERFGWMTAPSSTIVQSSPVHAGVCEAPEEVLEALLRRQVRRR